MMASSNVTIFRVTGLCAGNSPVTGEFPSQRPVTRSFHVFFDLRPNKRLVKQLRRRWFEIPSSSLWRHCNVHICQETQWLEHKVTWQVITGRLRRRVISSHCLGNVGELWPCFHEQKFRLTHLPWTKWRYFADDTFKRIFLNEMLEFRFNFHWNLFLVVKCICQHCFR